MKDIWSDCRLADVSSEEFECVNKINLRGVWNYMKYELARCESKEAGYFFNNACYFSCELTPQKLLPNQRLSRCGKIV